MKDILITMNSSGEFTMPSDFGRIEEHCAYQLKIKLDASFIVPEITYYTLSFEPYSLSRKIITENIYRDSGANNEMCYYGGHLYCPIYDYIAVSPEVMVQIDAYETDANGNVTAILKSGIFTLKFAPSLTGEGMMLETVRPDVKFFENVDNAVKEIMKTQVIDGANIKKFSITTPKYALSSIDSPQLKDYCVTSLKIKNSAVVTDTIAEGAVTSDKIANGSVTHEKLGANSVATENLADKSVTSSCLADGAVGNTKLANYSVSESKIRPLSVTTTKIADKSVTPAKLDRAYLTNHQSLAGYATEKWVKNQNYLTSHQSLSGYATEEWVKKQKFITDSAGFVKEEDLPLKLSDLKNDVAVSYVKQTLSDEEKDIALENIGAVKREEGKVLSSNDFTDADKEKLEKALTEHQDISMKADISSLSQVAFSGSYNDLTDLPDDCLFSEELKELYDSSYEHSLSAHAPSDAEKNIVNGAEVNGKTAEIKDEKIIISVLAFTEKEPVFMEVH